jgi:archaellum component FlaC
MLKRRKKSKRRNITNKIYQIVDIVGINEKELIPVGELYAYRGVYLMVPYGREMKISKRKKIPTYGEVHPYQDLNEIREELSKVRGELEKYKRKEKERWIEVFGDETEKLENDPPNDNSNQEEPLIYQIIDRRVGERFKKIEERLDRIEQRFEKIENLLKDLYSKIEVITRQLSPIKESPPQTTVGEKVYTLTPPQPQSKKLSEEEMEEILAKYDTEELMGITKESEYLKLAGTRTSYIFNIASADIEEIYSLDERKQIIEYARRRGYHPARYAAIAKACLDRNWNPLIPLTEEELKYATMPRSLEKDITSH